MKRNKSSVFKTIQSSSYDERTRLQLYNVIKDSKEYIQRMGLLLKVQKHTGCVNTIQWSDSGRYLLSGSDDMTLCITDASNFKVIQQHKTAHRANIFSAKFLPETGNNQIVSCSGDGAIIFTDLTKLKSDDSNLFNCHNGTAYEIVTLPSDPNSFMSCGEDGSVRWFDLRLKNKCLKKQCKDDVVIWCQQPITALAVNPKYSHQVAVGCSDNMTRTFDRRMLSTMSCDLHDRGPLKPLHNISLPTIDRCYRITSISYSPDGYDILTSYSSESVYLFNVNGNTGKSLKARDTTVVEEHVRKLMSCSPPVRRLRLRGDWSDTGPEARPEAEGIGQARPHLQTTIMQRMTNVLSRLLNDPTTRAALSAGGEDLLVDDNHGNGQSNSRSPDSSESRITRRNSTDSSSSTSMTHSAVQNAEQNRNNSEIENMIIDGDIPRNITHSIMNSSREYPMINENLNSRSALTYLNNGFRRNLKGIRYDKFDYTESMEPDVKQIYMGHRNARTMIKEASFYGDKYVISGSDCGHIFIWNKDDGKLVKLLEGDTHVVNCIQGHPSLPFLATSGIDYDIKIWAPVLEEPQFDELEAEKLMQRNSLMLDETRDTVTVPAAFMIRLLACVHSVRHNRHADQH